MPAAAFACALLAVTWSVRVIGVHLSLRDAGRKIRSEWAYAEDWFARQEATVEDPRERALLDQLKRDAIHLLDRERAIPDDRTRIELARLAADLDFEEAVEYLAPGGPASAAQRCGGCVRARRPRRRRKHHE